MTVGSAPWPLLVSALRPTFLKDAWMFLLLRPCGLALDATCLKTRRALDDIREYTNSVFVIRKILEQMPIGWCWIYSCDLHPYALPSALSSALFPSHCQTLSF